MWRNAILSESLLSRVIASSRCERGSEKRNIYQMIHSLLAAKITRASALSRWLSLVGA